MKHENLIFQIPPRLPVWSLSWWASALPVSWSQINFNYISGYCVCHHEFFQRRSKSDENFIDKISRWNLNHLIVNCFESSMWSSSKSFFHHWINDNWIHARTCEAWTCKVANILLTRHVEYAMLWKIKIREKRKKSKSIIKPKGEALFKLSKLAFVQLNVQVMNFQSLLRFTFAFDFDCRTCDLFDAFVIWVWRSCKRKILHTIASTRHKSLKRI